MRAFDVNVVNLSGRDPVPVTLPETEVTESPVTDTLSVATPRYSKRPSGKFKLTLHFSFV